MRRPIDLAIAGLCALTSVVSAVQNIKVQGSDFVNNVTSDRFQIIGIAYQPGGSDAFGQGSDPLSNATLCLRDAALMQDLGINTIRVYNVDPTLNHDMCVSIFNAVGIYILLDVNSPLPNQSLNPGDLTSSYSSTYLKHIFGVVEAFSNYPNILGYVSGNEVINGEPSIPPYVRAVTRDLKNYIAKHISRSIPVGYSAAQVVPLLEPSWAYLSCDINGDASDPSRSDFFGLNSYSWCGPTSPTANYEASSYGQLAQMFSNTSVPVFFSEYGCNKVEPRVFDEVPVLYGNLTDVMSGGLVYEWDEEENDYGLVWLYPNGTAQLRVDYDNLQSQYNKLDIKALESGNSSATMIKSPSCSKSLLGSSDFTSSWDLPTVPSGGQDLIQNGLSNPNQGKLVSVTDTIVNLAVYSSTGSKIPNLAIKPLAEDQSNTPNGQSTSGSATTSASGPAPSKKSGAGRVEAGVCALVILSSVAMLFL